MEACLAACFNATGAVDTACSDACYARYVTPTPQRDTRDATLATLRAVARKQTRAANPPRVFF
jgi:hypothetical protein